MKQIQHQKLMQSGRSMIEMLGVLAVVGVLSIGGVAGYRYAMAKHKQNEFFSHLSILLMDRTTKAKTGVYDCVDNGHGGHTLSPYMREQRELDEIEFLEVPGVWAQPSYPGSMSCNGAYIIQLPVETDIMDQNFILGLKSLADSGIVEDINFFYDLKDISDADLQELLSRDPYWYSEVEPRFIIYDRTGNY